MLPVTELSAVLIDQRLERRVRVREATGLTDEYNKYSYTLSSFMPCCYNHTFFFEVRHPRCVEPKLQNSKGTVKKQLYLLATSGWIT
jgi:hypothetical protein